MVRRGAAVALEIIVGNLTLFSILLKKSFSENQKKIFRTQMPYNERSAIG
jgi:hypothetical protein